MAGAPVIVLHFAGAGLQQFAASSALTQLAATQSIVLAVSNNPFAPLSTQNATVSAPPVIVLHFAGAETQRQ